MRTRGRRVKRYRGGDGPVQGMLGNVISPGSSPESSSVMSSLMKPFADIYANFKSKLADGFSVSPTVKPSSPQVGNFVSPDEQPSPPEDFPSMDQNSMPRQMTGQPTNGQETPRAVQPNMGGRSSRRHRRSRRRSHRRSHRRR